VAGALFAPQQPTGLSLAIARSYGHRQSFRWMSQDQCLSSSKERLVLNSPCPFTTLESAIGTGRGWRDRGKKLIQIGPVLWREHRLFTGASGFPISRNYSDFPIRYEGLLRPRGLRPSAAPMTGPDCLLHHHVDRNGCQPPITKRADAHRRSSNRVDVAVAPTRLRGTTTSVLPARHHNTRRPFLIVWAAGTDPLPMCALFACADLGLQTHGGPALRSGPHIWPPRRPP